MTDSSDSAVPDPAVPDHAAPEWPDGLPQCTECGHCCFFDDPRYVMLFDGDEERLGARADELSVEIKGRRFMRSADGHCIALRRDGERWLCSIYEIRPFLCRDFARGCAKCHEVVAERHPLARRRLPLAEHGR